MSDIIVEARGIAKTLAAQSLGVATVNGYSGNFPRGWQPPRDPATVAGWLKVASVRTACPVGEVAVVYED